MPIFVTVKKNLNDYVTSQAEADEGFTRMPERSMRDKSQRLIHDSESDESEEDSSGNKENESTDEFVNSRKQKDQDVMLDIYNKSDLLDIEQKSMISGLSELMYSKKKKDRSQKQNDDDETHEDVRKYKYRDNNNLEIIEEHVEEVEIFNEDFNEDDSLSFDSTNYDEEKEYVPKLEDFKIVKVLDKGSFGKVFLVENKLNNKFYAMKRIRKDVLIEKKQIENTQNEK